MEGNLAVDGGAVVCVCIIITTVTVPFPSSSPAPSTASFHTTSCAAPPARHQLAPQSGCFCHCETMHWGAGGRSSDNYWISNLHRVTRSWLKPVRGWESSGRPATGTAKARNQSCSFSRVSPPLLGRMLSFLVHVSKQRHGFGLSIHHPP